MRHRGSGLGREPGDGAQPPVVCGDVVLEGGADKGVGAERDAKVDERVVRMEDRADVRRADAVGQVELSYYKYYSHNI